MECNKNKLMYQYQHERHNKTHYPGTRQLCGMCGLPTERCEEDTMYRDEIPVCIDCYDLPSNFIGKYWCWLTEKGEMNKPTIKTLPSGYTLIRFSPECFAQILNGWTEESIPDEYIFHPSWNRERINDWWKEKTCA